jgi:hypothetical protein
MGAEASQLVQKSVATALSRFESLVYSTVDCKITLIKTLNSYPDRDKALYV